MAVVFRSLLPGLHETCFGCPFESKQGRTREWVFHIHFRFDGFGQYFIVPYVRCLGTHLPKPSKTNKFPISRFCLQWVCDGDVFLQYWTTYSKSSYIYKPWNFFEAVYLCLHDTSASSVTWILQPPVFKVLKPKVSTLSMSFDSKVFSSETLEAGLNTLREQHVKIESSSPDKQELQAELEDLRVETQTTTVFVINLVFKIWLVTSP